MVLIPFCMFLLCLRKTDTYRNQEQIRSPKLALNHEKRIKTILGQFRNTHARDLLEQDQAKQLIKAGFEYVMQKDNLAYFRKRK